MAGMVVQHNMNALNAYNRLNTNVNGLKKSSEKLSSGYRINRAGDDAAGLAISEKMRSQIRGLNQAKRNSQDGISMIQTFEGALQESHSILQRMKELATESANGTYDNATDRAAIQLEFDQLNDELNQIADTDFNGTIVLNGGEMADGTKAVNNEFNYNNTTREAMQLSAKDVNLVDGQVFDDTDPNGTYKTVADQIWNDLNAEWDRSDATKPQGPDSIDVTFQFDSSTQTWSCTGATNGADFNQISVDTDTANGGFTFGTGNAANSVNVVIDQTSLQNGDYITLTLNNPASATAAPSNAGATVADSSSFVAGADPDADLQLNDANLSVSVETIAVADYTEGMDNFFKALDGATATADYTASTATAKADLALTLADGTAVGGGAGTTDGVITLADGTTKVWAAYTAGSITFSTYDAANNAKGSQDLATITMTDVANTNASAGSITYNIGVEFKDYSEQAPTVVVKNPDHAASVSKSNAYDNSKAIMTYAEDITLQVGARTKDAVNFSFSYNDDGTADMGNLKANLNCSAREDGLNTANLSLANQDDANAAIDQIDKAINKVSMVRATFGSIQNRLEHKIENLTTTSENLTEAESTIRDTDMASEMLNYTKYNILQQAAQSMLAQANQQPQGILQLLG